MTSIFISYAREDGRTLALRLRDDLLAAGHQVWLDTSEIQGGADWARHIEDAIEKCDLLLALLSAGAYASEYCRAEQMRAQRKSKRIVPLLVQPDAERPIYLEHLNYFDFANDAVYDAKLYVLLSDIAGRPTASVPQPKSPSAFIPSASTSAAARDEKPDADAFSKHLERLREESWLGGRYWWPYFLFYVTDAQSAVDILRRGKLSAAEDEIAADRWRDFIHLDMRPRTPALWRNEGIRSISQRQQGQLDLPVYLMFDFEAVIRHAESRFSEGDIYRLRRSSKRAADFRRLPFEQIYHDSWFAAEERDEIMMRRQAVVLVPKLLRLEHLRHVWCRSLGERETLQTLLPAAAWTQWQDKITARLDFNLFHRKWTYVEEATLSAEQARLRFNIGEDAAFALRVEAQEIGGRKKQIWRVPDFVPVTDYTIDLSAFKAPRGYTLRLYLDNTLAYAGVCAPAEQGNS